jgi:phosphomannomutase
MMIDRIKQAFAGEDSNVLDGLTVNFPESWFNIRPSNTEPVLRLNAEASNQTELDALVAKVTAILTNTQNN